MSSVAIIAEMETTHMPNIMGFSSPTEILRPLHPTSFSLKIACAILDPLSFHIHFLRLVNVSKKGLKLGRNFVESTEQFRKNCHLNSICESFSP